MRDYGLAILNGLPRGAILLSHTDINWNTIRYLQVHLYIFRDYIEGIHLKNFNPRNVKASGKTLSTSVAS